jgi:hypothetical protein
MPRGRFEAGRTAYVIGSSPLFMVARAARRMVENPPVVVGVLLQRVYLDGYMRGLARTAASELVR